MRILQYIGRYIFALVFIGFGVLNIVRGGDASNLVPGFMPVPTIWVFVTGVAFLLAAISIIINVYSRTACIILGLLIFLIAFSVFGMQLIHGPNSAINVLYGQNVTANNAMGFLEALAIGAAAWMAAYGIHTRKREQKIAKERTSVDDITSEDRGKSE